MARKYTGHQPIIGGKQYRMLTSEKTKAEANKTAKNYRDRGWSVRVRKVSGTSNYPTLQGYIVFGRK